MCKALILYGLQACHQLLQVVPSDRLWESACLAEHHEQIGLVRWEHEVSVVLVLEVDHSRVQALDDIRMIEQIKNLLLVLGLIDLGLLFFVQLNEHFHWRLPFFGGLFHFFGVFFVPSETFEIAPLATHCDVGHPRDIWDLRLLYFWLLHLLNQLLSFVWLAILTCGTLRIVSRNFVLILLLWLV